MFKENIATRVGNREVVKLTREQIASKVVVDENNLIFQKLKEDNLHETFKEDTISVVYGSYLAELDEINQSGGVARCGSFFSGHFWEAVGTGIKCTAVYLFSGFIAYSSVVATKIIDFLKTINLIKFENDMKKLKILKFIIQLVIKTASQTLYFKLKTKCRWSFYIWKDISTNKNLII